MTTYALDWRDSIKVTIEKDNAKFWHYKLPRQIGSSQFLVDFGSEKVISGDAVCLIVLNKVYHGSINGIKMLSSSSAELGVMGRKYDWVLMDNIGYCPIEKIKSILSSISPLGSKILWIDSVEGAEIGGQAIKF